MKIKGRLHNLDKRSPGQANYWITWNGHLKPDGDNGYQARLAKCLHFCMSIYGSPGLCCNCSLTTRAVVQCDVCEVT